MKIILYERDTSNKMKLVLRKFHEVLRRRRKMGPVFISILLIYVFLLVGKLFFNDFVKHVFCAFELIFFFFYSYYSK
ncbi:hypothetical protein STEG23_000277, partial [Scotinomys teguina]